MRNLFPGQNRKLSLVLALSGPKRTEFCLTSQQFSLREPQETEPREKGSLLTKEIPSCVRTVMSLISKPFSCMVHSIFYLVTP